MEMLKRLKRFWLRQRIDWLRADIAVAIERPETLLAEALRHGE